ncbi:PHM/PNGase F [Rhizoclosmatium globosum]|uniref:PHM/PNGase F n=1 Tax=Rhizoclosmatium globosum TaxID=329046 RepID=A0A1Y2BH26_9FUNG|nr:PHM/PNGase F [Rhizoclosmatium globosum]|eukprot:ORY33880.1 PHM/PNGase F [Rhizoclosmatium globosum]
MRPTKTCDSMDYEIVSGQQQHIIFAYGQSTTNIGYHGPNNRGNAVVTLYPATANSTVGIQKAKALKAVKQLAATSNLNTVSIQFPNVTVPSTLTSYLCVHFELPSDQKYHVVQYEGIITTNVVHHMIMYGCTGKPSSFGDLYECSSMTAACSQFTLAWVPGAGTILFPAQAGFAIGTGVNAIRYFALQIHYNNQDNLSNLIDSSGLKIYYTTVLRPNDIGILTLGNEEIKIPANSPNFTSTTWNVCPASCTKQFSQNLTVISNGFHMHTLGYNITTKQIRNGQEIATLGDRNYYNFFYQGASPPTDPNAVIMPGDTLLTRCTYLPSSRSYTTRFGESTTNEMCFNFVTYYPAMPNIAVCLGSSQQQMAACSTQANLESLTGGSSLNVTAIANAMAKG